MAEKKQGTDSPIYFILRLLIDTSIRQDNLVTFSKNPGGNTAPENNMLLTPGGPLQLLSRSIISTFILKKSDNFLK